MVPATEWIAGVPSAVEWMAGASFLVWGLSCFLRAEEWNQWLGELEQRGRSTAVVLGGLLALLGSFIVYFHPVWHGLPAVLTAFGALCFLEGTAYLLFPQFLGMWIRWASPFRRPMVRLLGVVFVAIAILLLGMVYGTHGGTI